MKFLIKTSESKEKFSKEKFYFIFFIDINEQGTDKNFQKKFIENEGEDIIIEILKNSFKNEDLNLEKVFYKSKVIYFNKSIEKALCIKKINDENNPIYYSKPNKMQKFIKEIKLNDDTTTLIKNRFVKYKIPETNINEL